MPLLQQKKTHLAQMGGAWHGRLGLAHPAATARNPRENSTNLFQRRLRNRQRHDRRIQPRVHEPVPAISVSPSSVSRTRKFERRPWSRESCAWISVRQEIRRHRRDHPDAAGARLSPSVDWSGHEFPKLVDRLQDVAGRDARKSSPKRRQTDLAVRVRSLHERRAERSSSNSLDLHARARVARSRRRPRRARNDSCSSQRRQNSADVSASGRCMRLPYSGYL